MLKQGHGYRSALTHFDRLLNNASVNGWSVGEADSGWSG
jgi:hypothetical protein